jgi:hypothetical protein
MEEQLENYYNSLCESAKALIRRARGGIRGATHI